MDVWRIGDGSDILALLEDELRGGGMIDIILYPIGAKHTEPLICSIAQQAARCQVMCNMLDDITLTDEQVKQYATIEFRLFSKRQETDTLTDNIEALETMYISAYEEMYHQRYAEIIANLEKMAIERNLNCAD